MICYGIARSHLESRKENLAALSVMNLLLTQRHLFLPTLPEGFILSLLATHTHTHTHTHRGGYKFHWRRKGKDGYFFLAGGLNIQMISSKYHLRGIARRKPSLAPLDSITHR